MSDEPADLTLRLLRRMDAKLDRVLDDVADLKERVGGLEGSVANLSRRVDRVEARLDRIDRRLDLVEAS